MKQEITVKSALQPPPTKTEVIEALLSIKRDEHKKKLEIIEVEYKKLGLKLKAAAFKASKKLSYEKAEIQVSTWKQGNISVNFSIPVAEWREDFDKYQKLDKDKTLFDEKAERQGIRDALNGVKSGRVAAMLANEDTRKKLVALGAQIGVM